MWTEITEKIAQATGKPFELETHRTVSGGCINQGYALIGKDLTYFVKVNQASKEQMFAAEALGLKQMLATKTIRVPQPICWGISGQFSFLVLEWLEFARGGFKSSLGRNGA
jgi:fructosamine-3-kinase